jgi:hypothetical protein
MKLNKNSNKIRQMKLTIKFKQNSNEIEKKSNEIHQTKLKATLKTKYKQN